MGDLVDLDSRRPHTSGPLRCLQCGHEWMGVMLVDPDAVSVVACPACKCVKGVRAGVVALSGERHWTCLCGNDFFRYAEFAGWYCPNCGLPHDPPPIPSGPSRA